MTKRKKKSFISNLLTFHITVTGRFAFNSFQKLQRRSHTRSESIRLHLILISKYYILIWKLTNKLTIIMAMFFGRVFHSDIAAMLNALLFHNNNGAAISGTVVYPYYWTLVLKLYWPIWARVISESFYNISRATNARGIIVEYRLEVSFGLLHVDATE